MQTLSIPLEILPIREEGFHIFIRIKIFGTEVRMLLDTGASRTVFDSTTVKGISADLEWEENEDKATGLGSNTVDNFVAIIDKMEIGTFIMEDYQVGVLDLAHVNESYGKMGAEPIAGVLGSDVLVKYKAVIDLEKEMVMLKDSPADSAD